MDQNNGVTWLFIHRNETFNWQSLFKHIRSSNHFLEEEMSQLNCIYLDHNTLQVFLKLQKTKQTSAIRMLILVFSNKITCSLGFSSS